MSARSFPGRPKTRIRPPISIASSSWCVTRMAVLPAVRARYTNAVRSAAAVTSSRWPNASSALLLADEAFGHLDEVTAAALRTAFVELARTAGNTAILVTHQLEEAIEMGGRILVFGRPGKLLADIDLKAWPAGAVASLRAEIQRMLQSNAPEPRFAIRTEREFRA